MFNSIPRIAHAVDTQTCSFDQIAVLWDSMEGRKSQPPFVLLGERLKQCRETRRESIAEVSGAVEIDMDHLERIERGEVCPSEDVLTLLINHFSLHEQEAVQLWEWAGFTRSHSDGANTVQDLASKATLVLVALDARVMYSDSATIKADDNGVVLNFMQGGMQNQSLPVARIGMSYEHAAKVAAALQSALLRQRYLPKHKLLPPGDMR